MLPAILRYGFQTLNSKIAYLGVKYWARLYCPEVILGVYSPDEVEQREEREINPVPAQRMSVQEITSEVSTTTSGAGVGN
ncbi:Gifsy-2 prophage RecT [Salmonella enterica subsp. enterica]|uniref:Gifsy-2 prophage RecT n=1 Tax=Salmonella enterica I TaxID=59201 RepID=A0A379WT68_SALET|nr:Gifsy-2 prophage RecT [Salmonella enterica subsp. enterica]